VGKYKRYGSIYRRNGTLAETSLVTTETGQNLILKAVSEQ